MTATLHPASLKESHVDFGLFLISESVYAIHCYFKID